MASTTKEKIGLLSLEEELRNNNISFERESRPIISAIQGRASVEYYIRDIKITLEPVFLFNTYLGKDLTDTTSCEIIRISSGGISIYEGITLKIAKKVSDMTKTDLCFVPKEYESTFKRTVTKLEDVVPAIIDVAAAYKSYLDAENRLIDYALKKD